MESDQQPPLRNIDRNRNEFVAQFPTFLFRDLPPPCDMYYVFMGIFSLKEVMLKGHGAYKYLYINWNIRKNEWKIEAAAESACALQDWRDIWWYSTFPKICASFELNNFAKNSCTQ